MRVYTDNSIRIIRCAPDIDKWGKEEDERELW